MGKDIGPGGRDRPGLSEIEVTPAMIEAGAAEVACYSPEEMTTGMVAVAVFESMLSIHRLQLA